MVSFGTSDSSSESTPTKISTWNTQQKQLWSQLFDTAKAGMSTPTASYPNQMYVDRTPEEQAYFDAVSKMYSPADLDARRQAVNQVLSGKPSYEINPEATEQFYQESIKPGYMKEWEEVTLPTLKQQFVGPGYWGSARANAITEGSEDLATTLASKRAELMYQDELARRAAAESAASRQAALTGSGADTYTTAATTQANALGTAGQYARTIAQEKVTADLQRWLMGEQVGGVSATQYNPFVQLALALMGLQEYVVASESESNADSFGFSIANFAGAGENTGTSKK